MRPRRLSTRVARGGKVFMTAGRGTLAIHPARVNREADPTLRGLKLRGCGLTTASYPALISPLRRFIDPASSRRGWGASPPARFLAEFDSLADVEGHR